MVDDGHNVGASCSDEDFIWHGGVVEGGFSSTLRPGWSAGTQASDSSDLMPSARTFRVLSCRQVYLPYCNAIGQADRMCCTVGW